MYSYYRIHVPIKSLKYKCLSKLGSMMRPSQSPKTITNSSSCESSPPESIIQQPITTSSYVASKSYLHLPITLVQLIIEHLTLERIPIRHQALCALLSNGGCYSLEISSIIEINKFSKENVKQIFDILADNCDHLVELHFHCDGWVPLEYIKPIKCEHLSFRMTSLDDLIDIFSAFPNLIRLNILCEFEDSPPTTEQKMAFFEELKKPIYNQIRYSLRELFPYCIGLSDLFIIKLISYFPHLTNLECILDDRLCDAIQRVRETGYIDDISEDGLIVTSADLKNVSAIFTQLQGIETRFEISSDLSVLVPNLQELNLYKNHIENNIENLKYLTCLTIAEHFVFMEPILSQIGRNLEYLSLCHFSHSIDVSTIARYCPRLREFEVKCTEILVHRESSLDVLYSQMAIQEPVENPFRYLETLTINYLNGSCCEDINVIYYILRHAINIEAISLNSCRITEENLTQLLKINPMTNLGFLIISEHPHSLISKHCFNQFINSFDQLCYAKLKSSSN